MKTVACVQANDRPDGSFIYLSIVETSEAPLSFVGVGTENGDTFLFGEEPQSEQDLLDYIREFWGDWETYKEVEDDNLCND